MPKARKRKKGTVTVLGGASRPQPTNVSRGATTAQNTSVGSAANTVRTNRPLLSPSVPGPQSLVFSGLVALGCWGMAFSFFVFSTDPNHALFGGMAVLMALLWSFSFGIRVRRLLHKH